MYEWDEKKAAGNLAKHGVAFEAIYRFDWETMIEEVDERDESGELRCKAMGFLGAKLHVLIYTPRAQKIRIISLRKATKREERDYAKKKA